MCTAPVWYPNRICRKGQWLRIGDVYPGITATKEDRGKITCLCCHKFNKIFNYFIFEQVPGTVQNKNLCQLTKNYSIFSPKTCHYALKSTGMRWGSGHISQIRDTGSGTTLSRIPDHQGVKKAPDPGPGTMEIADLYSLLSIFSLLSWTV